MAEIAAPELTDVWKAKERCCFVKTISSLYTVSVTTVFSNSFINFKEGSLWYILRLAYFHIHNYQTVQTIVFAPATLPLLHCMVAHPQWSLELKHVKSIGPPPIYVLILHFMLELCQHRFG